MLFLMDDGKYLTAQHDVLCIIRLPTGKFHLLMLEDRPLPGQGMLMNERGHIRLKSKAHHTTGAGTLEEAQRQLDELRTKFIFDDENVIRDRAIDVNDPECVMLVPNWLRKDSTLKIADVLIQSR